jgi:Mitochondrial carrier protein
MTVTRCCGKAITLCARMIAMCIILFCARGSITLAICGPPSISMGRFSAIHSSGRLSKDLHRKDCSINDEKGTDGRIVNRHARNTTDLSFLESAVEIAANAAASGAVAVTDQLTYMQTMTAGALSRTMAQTLMHPANTYKTLLQLKGSGNPGGILTKLTPERLLRGVDAQFIMSLPHGAFYFFVIDQVKTKLSGHLSSKFNFLQDFAASTISTVFCSIVSTPQMVLTDRLMAGVYPTSMDALKSILNTEGIAGFYTGWWPALAQKIPSYG